MGYTSSDVKARYNRAHYDVVSVLVPKGGREELQAIAQAHGMSVSRYLRHLIIADNHDDPAAIEIIWGGGR